MKRQNVILAVGALIVTAVVISVLYFKGINSSEGFASLTDGANSEIQNQDDRVIAAILELSPIEGDESIRSDFKNLDNSEIVSKYSELYKGSSILTHFFLAVNGINHKDSALLHSSYFNLLAEENSNQSLMIVLLENINNRGINAGFQENWCRINLSGIYRVSNQPMQAVQQLRTVLEIDSNHLEAIYWLGEMAIQSGQLEKARERFKKLVSLQPQNQDFLKRLLAICEELGDSECVEAYSE